MKRGVSDPAWKSGPPEPTHSHTEHRIHDEDFVYDFDGPGRDEADDVNGTIHTVVIEAATCRREGCDASISKRHVYTVESFNARTQQVLLYAVRRKWGDNSIQLTDDVVIEYLANNVVIVDYDMEPILGIQFDDDETYTSPEVHGYYEDDDVLGYVYPTRTFTSNDARGPCHGRPEEPSPEPYGL